MVQRLPALCTHASAATEGQGTCKNASLFARTQLLLCAYNAQRHHSAVSSTQPAALQTCPRRGGYDSPALSLDSSGVAVCANGESTTLPCGGDAASRVSSGDGDGDVAPSRLWRDNADRPEAAVS